MSGRSRSKLGEWLKAIGLSVLFAALMVLVACAVTVLIWQDDLRVYLYCRLAALGVGLLAFVVALSRCSPVLRRWLAGVSWTRRVSLWLFALTLTCFAASQMDVKVTRGRWTVELEEGGVGVLLDRDADAAWTGSVRGFRGVEMCWMPLIRSYGPWNGMNIAVLIPLWLVGVTSLWPWWWPWWWPWLFWVLGGRVRGHTPLGSWNYRLALAALLLSGILCWLCYQSLEVCYADGSQFWLSQGQLEWYHDTQDRDLHWPWEEGFYCSGGVAWWWIDRRPQGPGVLHMSCPMWPVPIVCLLWLILAVRPRHLFRRRWENGLCLHCGYDLCGLKERCTECGQPIEPEQLAVLAENRESRESHPASVTCEEVPLQKNPRGG